MSSYLDSISDAKKGDAAVAEALNGIEFVFENIRPLCLDLLDLRYDLESGYNHGKEYARLVEMLMSDVLEKHDGLCLETSSIRNRQARKRLINDTNKLLRQMDFFMQESRGQGSS